MFSLLLIAIGLAVLYFAWQNGFDWRATGTAILAFLAGIVEWFNGWLSHMIGGAGS